MSKQYTITTVKPLLIRRYQTATQGIWWKELANDVGIPRDMICPAKAEDDKRIFAIRILPVEGMITNFEGALNVVCMFVK